MKNFMLLVILLCSNCCWSQASIVQFQANPTSIDSLFTKTLSLRCSVQKFKPRFVTANRFYGSTTTNLHHATSTTHPPAHTSTTTLPTTTTSHRSTTSPSTKAETSTWPTLNSGVQNETEFSHVTAIVISKVNPLTNQIDTIADVTPFEAVTVSSTFMLSVSAQGNSLSSPVMGEMGYLEVKWQRPNQDQSGEYMCEVFGLDPHNHPVTMKSNLTLIAHEPTMQDFAKYISGLEKRLDELKVLKFQTGRVSCYANHFSTNVRVSFAGRFNTVPMVFTSFSDVEYNGNVDGEFKVQVIAVNTTYFTYDCLAAHTSFYFNWLAIEN